MERKIKLATVVGKMKGGGVETIVMSYLEHLSTKNFLLTLLVDQDSTQVPTEKLKQLGVRLVWIPPYQQMLAYHRAIYELCKQERFDIIHAHINTLSVFPLFAAYRAKVPVRIVHNHSTMGKGETKRNLMKLALRPFAKVFPTTLCACSFHAGQWIFGLRTSFVVMPDHLGFQQAKYGFSKETRDSMRKKLGIENNLVLGHAGRFMATKNHKFLVEIFAEVVKKQPTAKLLLLGEGELFSAVQAQVKLLGLTNSILFVGQQENVADYYQAMDLLLFPSLYEGKGLVPMEAQLTGLPVLVSDKISNEIVIKQNLVRFLPLTESAVTWAKEALQFLSRSPARHQTTTLSENTVATGGNTMVSAENLSEWYYALVSQIKYQERR